MCAAHLLTTNHSTTDSLMICSPCNAIHSLIRPRLVSAAKSASPQTNAVAACVAGELKYLEPNVRTPVLHHKPLMEHECA